MALPGKMADKKDDHNDNENKGDRVSPAPTSLDNGHRSDSNY